MAEARDTQDARNDRRGRSAQAPRQRARRADAARTAAWHLLAAVDEGAYANLELPHVLRRFRLAGRDAAFATELALGTVRQQGLYDLVIARATGRAVDTLDPELMRTLRLGAHQALSMRVPPLSLIHISEPTRRS